MHKLILAMLISFPALADWEGTLHFTHDPPRPGAAKQDGVMHSKKGKVRVEQETPMGHAIMIFDFKAKKGRLLLPERKSYVEMSEEMSMAGAMPPACDSGKAEACLTAEGYKKTGSDTIDGRKTTVWEQEKESRMGHMKQKLWVVDGSKEFMFLRSTTQSERGSTRVDVTDFKEKPQADSLFETPSDYTPTDMRGAFGGAGHRPPGKP